MKKVIKVAAVVFVLLASLFILPIDEVQAANVTITFNGNGGTPTTTSQTFTTGGQFGSYYYRITRPERPGYLFDGWFTQRSGGTKIDHSSDVPYSACTYYAHWSKDPTYTPPVYTISFNANGGTCTTAGFTRTHGAEYGDIIDGLKATRTGHTFQYWKTANGTRVTSGTLALSDATLYAHWTKTPYIVTLDYRDGSGAKPTQTYYYDQKYYNLPQLKRSGYSFDGWFTEPYGGDEVTKDDKVELRSRTLYGQWTLEQHTIKFDPNGGSCSQSGFTRSHGEEYGNVIDGVKATKTGYKFKGWYTAKTGGTKVSNGDVALSDVTLYAQWQINTYYVYLRDGAEILDCQSYYYPYVTYSKLPDLEKEGYNFDGWFTAAANGTQIKKDTPIDTSLGSRTLYAQWRLKQYTITFDGNGGTSSVDSVSYVYEPGGRYQSELSIGARRDGYRFIGWGTDKYDSTSLINDKSTRPAHDITLYAHWQGETYTTTFDANKGQCTGASSLSYTYGDDVTYGGDINGISATRTNYIFAGWFTAPDGGVAVGSSTKVPMGNTTVYAHWNGAPFTVTLYYNDTNNTVKNQTYLYGSKYSSLPEPTLKGYKFGGWYILGSTEEVTSTTLVKAKDIKLSARWIANQYTTTFDGNGGTSTQPSMEFTYMEEYGTALKSISANWDDNRFVGWFTQPVGGKKVEYNSLVPYGNTTLYAHWEAPVYLVTFDYNGGHIGGASGAVKAYIYGRTYKNMPIPNKTCYEFIGWFTEDGKEVTSDTLVEKEIDKLIAHWELDTCTITLDPTDGECDEESITLQSGIQFRDSLDGIYPKKPGYAFDGWYTAAFGGEKIEWYTPVPKDDITLYAQWVESSRCLVKFKANGGVCYIEKKNYDKGEAYRELPKATRDGYWFDGWYTKPEGGSRVFDSSIVNDAVTLYAQWSTDTTIYYYAHDGLMVGDACKETVVYNGVEPDGTSTVVQLYVGVYCGNIRIESEQEWIKCDSLSYDREMGDIYIPLEYNITASSRVATINIIFDNGINKLVNIEQKVSNANASDVLITGDTLASMFTYVPREKQPYDDALGLCKDGHCGYVVLGLDYMLFYETYLLDSIQAYVTDYVILMITSEFDATAVVPNEYEENGELGVRYIDRAAPLVGSMTTELVYISSENRSPALEVLAKDINPEVYMSYTTRNLHQFSDLLASGAIYEDYDTSKDPSDDDDGAVDKIATAIEVVTWLKSTVDNVTDPVELTLNVANAVVMGKNIFEQYTEEDHINVNKASFMGYSTKYINENGDVALNVKKGIKFDYEYPLTAVSNNCSLVFKYRAAAVATGSEINDILARRGQEQDNAICMYAIIKVKIHNEFYVYYDFIKDDYGIYTEGTGALSNCGYLEYTRRAQ